MRGQLENLTPLPGISKGGKEIPRQKLWVHIWADWEERPTALGKMLLVAFYYLFYATFFTSSTCTCVIVAKTPKFRDVLSHDCPRFFIVIQQYKLRS